MRYLAPILVVVLLGAVASFVPAVAQPSRARQGVESGQVRSLGEILNGIRRERPGNLADVQGPNFGPGGDPRYRLKWLTPDGRVLWLDTDARTGRVLGVEGDDRGPPPRAGIGGFPGPRGTIAPQNLPQGYDRGPPPGYRGPPPGYRGPPPGYNGPPPGYRGPPPGFRGPPPGSDRGSPDRGSRGGSGRNRFGR